ncbi:MAG: hypothetical protein AB7T09_03305 [Planctomycetota bacterium]
MRWGEFLVTPGLPPTLVTALEALVDALDGFEFALIGGQAVFLHGYQRFSKDLDVGVIVPVKQVAARLRERGFVPAGGARFYEPLTRVSVDVVKLPRCAIPSVKAPDRYPVGARSIPVIDLETLLALKVKLGRARDEADVVELLKTGRALDAARLSQLLRGLGEEPASFERLAERARREQELEREGPPEDEPEAEGE